MISSWQKAHPVVEETRVVDGGATWDYFIDIGDKSETEKGKAKKESGEKAEIGGEEKFETSDGDKHKLYVKKIGEKYFLMVESDPTTYADFIDSLKVTDDSLVAIKAQAKGIAQKIDTLVIASTKENGENKEAEIELELDKLAPLTSKLMSAQEGSALPSDQPTFGGLVGDFGSMMTINYLTGTTIGTAATAKGSAIYDTLNERREGNGSYYVRGHLLSEKLHGTGSEWKNLTPLSRSGNSQHESQVESQIKDVIPAEGAGGHRAFRYIVTPVYGRGVDQGLIQKITDSSDLPEAKKRKEAIVRAEKFVPTVLHCTIVEIDPTDKSKAIKPKNPADKAIDGTYKVDNPVDQTGPEKYQLENVPKVSPLEINKELDEAQLYTRLQAYGVTMSQVRTINDKLYNEDDKLVKYYSQKDMANRTGIAESVVENIYVSGEITFK